ncbi:hypothetical protein [Bradyrhizobium sp. USDA 3650]
MAFAAPLIGSVCAVSVDPGFAASVDGTSSNDPRLISALRANSTAGLFDWMMDSFSFQGISDSVAHSYLESNGNATWQTIKSQLAGQPTCPLLPSYWTFEGCRYDKTSKSCSQPDHMARCPLPSHPLRNGRLNQTAFGLYLFIRDQTRSDLVGWIDERLEETGDMDFCASQEALIEPMRHIFGVSDKVLAMTLSAVLMADQANRPRWFDIGSQVIVVDTLVHNFLRRTGILAAFDAAHVYGPKCYQHGGCSEILRRVAACIDARVFGTGFPANFPRLIQHALWRYCAADELDICNGNNIDDTKYCTLNTCHIYSICSRNKAIAARATNKTRR